MICSLGQPLPRPSTMAERSVLSFSSGEKSSEISFKLGQLNTCAKRQRSPESQRVESLVEQRLKPPRLEHPSILRLVRHFLSETKCPSSSLVIRFTEVLDVKISKDSRLGQEKAMQASIIASTSLQDQKESLTSPGHFCSKDLTCPI
nr:hypothetical protein Iba_chr07eCG0980 [Ipomoea batatas]